MRSSRKLEHIRHALSTGQSGFHGLADVKLVPNALPEISLSSVSLATQIGELQLSSPIIMNAMTGGSLETEDINKRLAEAARDTGVSMAVGSQMAAIRDKSIRSSYEVVRQVNPDGIVFANLGSEASVAEAMEAVEMLQADGIQIHLNVMQELIMPEGDRQFQGMTERIAEIVNHMSVPVIVKEVGFGIAMEAAEKLKEAGVKILDVGGTGGTSFAAVENARRANPLPFLNDWGCTTAVALLECAEVFIKGSLIASGGIRTSLEVVKALALGADAVGMAGALLQSLYASGTDGLIEKINNCHTEMALLMVALGTADIPSLHRTPVVIGGETAHWCGLRQINLSRWATRER